MQLWIKFHDMYKSAINRDTITPEEEAAFLETKSLIARKYQALKEYLEISSSYDDRTFDVISQLLSLKGVAAISDLSLHKIENDWHGSYIVLNKLLGELDAKEESLKKVSKFRLLLRDLAGSPLINLALLIIVILAIYMVLVYMGRIPGAVESKGKIEFKTSVENK
ncbi:MAG: hypothetical protein V1883_00500 [Candidatus Omnitrophota bacterium]